MKHFSNFITKHSKLVLIISLLLLIPCIIGYFNTKINYNILVYLPDNIETIKGQNILKDDLGIGSYAFVMTDNRNEKQILELEDKIRDVSGVNKVASIVDLLGTTISKDMLPDEILNKIYHDDETIIVVTFKEGTSAENTLIALDKVNKIVEDASNVNSLSQMVLDTKILSDHEVVAYVVIAVVLCLIVLLISTDSYIIPFLLLFNIAVAVIYNMGTNIVLGEISYITKAIAAILQLAVTTDFSIFLYHKYQQAKEKNKKNSNQQNMVIAMQDTITSVLGSSLTTFAGFLALCTMQLTLGKDIGIVMAKGILCGLICVMTLFPALLLVFDKKIEKYKHKVVLPELKRVQGFVLNHNKLILVLFLLLIIPAVIGNSNYKVYYKLDESLPNNLPSQVSNSKLADKYNIISSEIVILNSKTKDNKVEELAKEINELKGVSSVLTTANLLDPTVKELLPKDLANLLNNKKYKLLIVSSDYEIASPKLNKQIEDMNKIIKKYDKSAILAGEGPLMNDLVKIADHDFKAVNYTSIAVIFIIMFFVLKSISLPIILIITIEFAIFMNLACAYFTGTTLPFVASIIVGTIQLGATIDYAILMSTKYLEERSIEKDKKKAMEKTLSQTVPSILTSGLCFFAATIGVSLYTKIDMIGSITTLLSRGSIISMLVVILILPSILMLTDKIIMKLTITKEAK